MTDLILTPEAPANRRGRSRSHKPEAHPLVRLIREPVPEYVPGAEHVRTGQRIRDPEDLASVMRPLYAGATVEQFYVVTLNSQSAVLGIHLVTQGLLNSSLVHPREVFRAAILDGAAGIILSHNHPSGDTTPSAEDRAVTRQMVEAGRLLNLPVYDHIIIGAAQNGTPARFASLAGLGLL